MAKHIVAFSLLLSLTILSGCGGTPVPAITLTAQQVFAPKVGDVWTFQNGYGAINTVTIEAPASLHRVNPDGTVTDISWNDQSNVSGRTGNNVVFHYQKTDPCSYWALCIPDAELWFVLNQNQDGSWRSTASLIDFPQGCPWCSPGPAIFTSDVLDNQPGIGTPYQIIPPTLHTGDMIVDKTRVNATFNPGLTFDNTIPAGAPLTGPADGEFFETDFYIEDVSTPVYSGPASVSDQFEGPCGHEKWYFAPGWGLVKVETPYDGGEVRNDPSCASFGLPQTHDPKLYIERIR